MWVSPAGEAGQRHRKTTGVYKDGQIGGNMEDKGKARKPESFVI
jgi:hypothetical protein